MAIPERNTLAEINIRQVVQQNGQKSGQDGNEYTRLKQTLDFIFNSLNEQPERIISAIENNNGRITVDFSEKFRSLLGNPPWRSSKPRKPSLDSIKILPSFQIFEQNLRDQGLVLNTGPVVKINFYTPNVSAEFDGSAWGLNMQITDPSRLKSRTVGQRLKHVLGLN